jgi:hypothetical protein
LCCTCTVTSCLDHRTDHKVQQKKTCFVTQDTNAAKSGPMDCIQLGTPMHPRQTSSGGILIKSSHDVHFELTTVEGPVARFLRRTTAQNRQQSDMTRYSEKVEREIVVVKNTDDSPGSTIVDIGRLCSIRFQMPNANSVAGKSRCITTVLAVF